MRILDKLRDGSVNPAERPIGNRPEYTRHLGELEQAEEALLEDLGPGQRELFEEVEQKLLALTSFLERDAFLAGFRLCGGLLLDVLESTP